jgi:hypothetical protein
MVRLGLREIGKISLFSENRLAEVSTFQKFSVALMQNDPQSGMGSG